MRLAEGEGLLEGSAQLTVPEGTLYPLLNRLRVDGQVAAEWVEAEAGHPRKYYKLTAEGKERFAELVSTGGPSAWDDESFGVHFAFFGSTTAENRLRILEGRRSRLEERLEGVRTSLARSREKLDAYTLELQRHGLESVEREVRWLTELIDTERGRPRATSSDDAHKESRKRAGGDRPGAGSVE